MTWYVQFRRRGRPSPWYPRESFEDAAQWAKTWTFPGETAHITMGGGVR